MKSYIIPSIIIGSAIVVGFAVHAYMTRPNFEFKQDMQGVVTIRTNIHTGEVVGFHMLDGQIWSSGNDTEVGD